jgi:hypothetical protein
MREGEAREVVARWVAVRYRAAAGAEESVCRTRDVGIEVE